MAVGTLQFLQLSGLLCLVPLYCAIYAEVDRRQSRPIIHKGDWMDRIIIAIRVTVALTCADCISGACVNVISIVGRVLHVDVVVYRVRSLWD